MIRLRIDEILTEQGKSKYWLYKQMEPMSYQNLNKIYKNETTSIKFDILEKLKKVLDVSYDELIDDTYIENIEP